MAYSNNGETWIPISDSTFPSGTGISSIAYGNGLWVAVGGNGRIAYSNNGINWSAVRGDPFGGQLIRSISYAKGMWVAVGGNVKITYSNDGINWSSVEDSPFRWAAGVYDVFYGNDRWVAVGSGRHIAYSVDGKIWDRLPNVGNEALPIRHHIYGQLLTSIAFGKDRWVVTNDTGYIAFSDDNTNTWVTAKDSTFRNETTSQILNITYGNGMWFAVGTDGRMAYSFNGDNWFAVLDHPFGTDSIMDIAYGNGKWIAVGWNGKMAFSDVIIIEEISDVETDRIRRKNFKC
jgi:hypothetical protein